MNTIKNALGGGNHHNNDTPATGTYTGSGLGTGTQTVPGTPSGTNNTSVSGSQATNTSGQTAGQKLESHIPGTQQHRATQGTTGSGATTGATTGRERDTVTTVTHIDKERDNERAIADRNACDTKFYTTVEDRPVVKEHVDVIREHRPVEKEFVVETRHTGREKELQRPPNEVLDQKTRVISEARPSPCEGAPRI